MYELKVVEGLSFRYLVDPTVPEIWRVDSKGNKRLQKSYKQRSGYEVVNLNVKGKNKLFYVHRVVWMAVNNKTVPYGYQINHKDYNRGNNKIDNLEVLSIKDNLNYSKENRRYNGAKRIRAIKDTGEVLEFRTHKECAEYLDIPTYKISDYLRCVAYREGLNGYKFENIEEDKKDESRG